MAEDRAHIDPDFQALVRREYAGKPAAMAALGARLVIAKDAPRAIADGAALIEEASRQGDPEGHAYNAVLAAGGIGRAQSWADAIGALNRAVDLGVASASADLRLLRELALDTEAKISEWLAAFRVRQVHDDPHLIASAEFLPPALCAHIVALACPKLSEAKVFDQKSGELKLNAVRTSDGMVCSLFESGIVMQLVRARIARLATVAVEALEPTEVLHYTVGQQYRPHVDFFHPAVPNFAEQMRLRGQRVKTCLVYLNDDLEGGETEFAKLGIKFRGALGEALVFENVRPNGSGDIRSVHAGLPPTRGEKWLLSQWIRTKAQPIV